MNSFDKLENYHIRMKTAISELRNLSDNGNPDDFIDAVALSYGEIVKSCEHRREVIQRRKYGK